MWDQSPSLQGRFLTMRPPGKSPRMNVSYSFTLSPVSLALWTQKAQWHRPYKTYASGPKQPGFQLQLCHFCAAYRVKDREAWHACPRGCKELDTTERLNNNTEWALKCISSHMTGEIICGVQCKMKMQGSYGSLGMKTQQSRKTSTGCVPRDAEDTCPRSQPCLLPGLSERSPHWSPSSTHLSACH